MNDNAESASTDNVPAPMSMEYRAQKALGLVNAKEQLTELAAASAGIIEITNKAGYDECHAKRMVLKNKRVEIGKTGKTAREDATKFSQAVIAAEKELIGIISPEEDRLQALQQAWDDAREAERAEAARIEAERIQKQKDALAVITGSLSRLFGAGVTELELAINQLEGFDMSQFDDVFMPDAVRARDDALVAIFKAKAERIDLDEKAAELRRKQEEQEKRDREAAEQRRIADKAAQDERDRLASEAAVAAALVLAERRELQEKEDAERAARLAEEDRQRAAQAEADRVERERVQAEQAARQAELDRQAAEQRQLDEAAAQAQREAQEKADQERRDREAAEQAAAAQARAQAEAEASRRAALLYVVAMPDGSRWAVPLMVIATDRAKHYAHEFDGDLERSLAEDTLPLFDADPYQAHDWAANNMNWSDVKGEARIYEPAKPLGDDDFAEGWVNGEYQVVNTQEKQA